mgnify:FL=1
MKTKTKIKRKCGKPCNIMNPCGSQTKRKRDATTGSTAKVHPLDWRDRYLDKFKTTPHRGIEEFIDKLFLDILEHNKDEMTGLYDYDGIAQEVIDLVKK